ncbi:hypothetical protein OROMI_006781 [Orobanche minor]
MENSSGSAVVKLMKLSDRESLWKMILLHWFQANKMNKELPTRRR